MFSVTVIQIWLFGVRAQPTRKFVIHDIFSIHFMNLRLLFMLMKIFFCLMLGESCSVAKDLESTLATNAVYQDKTNILFSVRSESLTYFWMRFIVCCYACLLVHCSGSFFLGEKFILKFCPIINFQLFTFKNKKTENSAFLVEKL